MRTLLPTVFILCGSLPLPAKYRLVCIENLARTYVGLVSVDTVEDYRRQLGLLDSVENKIREAERLVIRDLLRMQLFAGKIIQED